MAPMWACLDRSPGSGTCISQVHPARPHLPTCHPGICTASTPPTGVLMLQALGFVPWGHRAPRGLTAPGRPASPPCPWGGALHQDSSKLCRFTESSDNLVLNASNV